jgi:8-oxo-dGTP pyrophosphatase MutT (NUDIX family)
MYHRIGKNGRRYWGTEGAGILFTDGKQVLLLKRAIGDNKQTWGMPGGKLKKGELDIDGAIRESKEECGHAKGRRIAKFVEKDGMHRWATFIYKIDKPFKCRLSKEHNAWKWYNLKQLENITLHPKLRENLDSYLKLIKRKFNQFKSFREWVDLRDKIQ